MLTKKQTFLYWKTWASVCEAQGWERSDNERRYALHDHCRCPQSMKAFTNRDFSRFLAGSAPFRDVVDIRDRDRENALHTISKDAAQAGFAPAYLRAIARDLYDTDDYTRLPIEQLEGFRNIIHNRARSHSSPVTRHSSPAAPQAADCPF